MFNDYMNLLNSVPSELKKHLRSIENVSEKIIKREWSKTFNHVCLQENVWPTYTHITVCTNILSYIILFTPILNDPTLHILFKAPETFAPSFTLLNTSSTTPPFLLTIVGNAFT